MGLTASSPTPLTSSSTLDQLVKPSASTPGRSMMTSFGVPFSIVPPLDPFADSARAARTSIIAFLRRAISVGYLEVHEGSEVLSFGRSLPGCNIVRLLVTQGTFWTRVFHSGDLGCSSFLYLARLAARSLTSDYSQRGLHDGRSPHRRERPRLRDERMGSASHTAYRRSPVPQIWLDNEESMQCMSSSLHRVASALSGWTNALFGQTLSRARLNAMASYDQSNDLFRVRALVHPSRSWTHC
jgi:cyclopropane-fatty-acyl-phospholipid synthase